MPHETVKLRVPLRPENDVCTVHFRISPTAVPGGGDLRELGARFLDVRIQAAVRIVYDVSPLSHPLTGVGNYVRGSLAGLVEAAGGEHEIVAFAPTSPAGRHAIPRALDGLDVELQARAAALLAALARCLEPARPARAGALPRRLRRLPLLRLDVPAAGRRRPRDHRPRPRAAPLPGVGDAEDRRRCTAPSTRTRRAPPISSSSTPSTPAATSSSGSASRPERVRVAYPGVKDAFRPDGERADLGRPYVLTVATLEPRKNLADPRRGAPAARRGDAARGRGRQRLGRPARAARTRTSSGSASSPTTSWRGSTAARPSPSTRPASRASGCRSPRRWRAARPRSPRRTSRWTRPRARPPSGPTRTTPRRSQPRSGRRSQRRDELVPAGLEHARRFTWRAAGESFLAGYEEASSVIRAAVDVSPLVQTRAGTARHVRGLLGALAGREGIEVAPRSFGGSGKAGVGRARHVVVLRRAAALGARARPAPLHDLPRPAAGARAVRRHAARPRARPAPGALPALAPPLGPRRDRSRRDEPPTGSSPSPSSRSARRSSCSVCPRSG